MDKELDDIEQWDKRRLELTAGVIAAVEALLDHTCAASFAIPMKDGTYVAAGSAESIPRVLQSELHRPSPKDC